MPVLKMIVTEISKFRPNMTPLQLIKEWQILPKKNLNPPYLRPVIDFLMVTEIFR